MKMPSINLKGALVFLNLLISFAVSGNTNGRLMARVSSPKVDISTLKECPESDNRKKYPDPENCGVFFACSYLPIYSKYLLYPVTCTENNTFDVETLRCSDTEFCPQTIPELTLPRGWRCDDNGFKHAVPSNCRQYYTCDDCKSPENLGRKCYTSDNCSETEYFDNFKRTCVPSAVCPHDRLELPKDGQWHCEENDELHQNPEDCSKYYSCHRCSTNCQGWCYQMYQCSSKEEHFDETEKKCVSEGECKIKPTEPTTQPPVVEDQKCDREHRHKRWPNKENCQCYYECTRIFIPFLPYVYKIKQNCCDAGSYDPVGMQCSENTC